MADVYCGVLAASDHETASIERLDNLEATLNSKTKYLVIAKVKYVQLEEKYKKTIEYNIILSSTVRELDVSLMSTSFAEEKLPTEVNQLK